MRTQQGRNEFWVQIISLLVIVITVHALYELKIRPDALRWQQESAALLESNPEQELVPPVVMVLKDMEQEACIIIMLWGMAILGYKAFCLQGDIKLLDLEFVEGGEGTRILPEDARDLTRRLETLPAKQRRALLPRCLKAALHRFESTRNIQDVSETVGALCESEGERQESELSMVRYIAWAIPSIGFIGTVRGIGLALSKAQAAVEGNIAPVTNSLGTAFNSTLVSLILSIILMFVVHQFQLQQERHVLDVEAYVESHLVRRLHVRRESAS